MLKKLGIFLIVALFTTASFASVKSMSCTKHKFYNNRCDVYLGTNIGSPDLYTELDKLLTNSRKGDRVYIHLAGNGGRGSGLVYILNAMNSSKATVISVVEGPVLSAHAVLAFGGDEIVIDDNVYFLFHAISARNMIGKICMVRFGQMDRGLSAYEKCLQTMPKLVDFYDNAILGYIGKVMTKKENEEYLAGHDIIITGKDMKKRLKMN